MIIILYVYGAGALLVAIRFAWHMTFRLDRFDWHYSKEHIWMAFVFFVLVWPFMLVIPRHFINPSRLFEDSSRLAALMRERDHLWQNPPPCGSLIRYRQGRTVHAETCGEFLFHASQVEQALRHHVAEAPHLLNDDEGAILNWLRRRDEALAEPTDVPSAWGRFDIVANELVRAGRAKVHCLKCGIDIEQDKIVTNDDDGRLGWNFDRLVCPNGHNLLVVQTGHSLPAVGPSQDVNLDTKVQS